MVSYGVGPCMGGMLYTLAHQQHPYHYNLV